MIFKIPDEVTEKSTVAPVYLRQGGYVIIVVCLSERICMKFSGKVGNGPMNK